MMDQFVGGTDLVQFMNVTVLNARLWDQGAEIGCKVITSWELREGNGG